METPLKFRWSALISFAVWVLVATCYALGIVRWAEFTFVHTFIAPVVLLIALLPLSVKSVVTSSQLMPIVGAWAGTMVPLTYLACRRITGFGAHCDKAAIAAGALIGVAITLVWLCESWRHRRLASA